MTTTTAIIKRALRESNLVPIGQTPTTNQNTEGMELLASLIAGVYGYDVGEKLQDWLVGTAGVEDPDQSWSETEWVYPLPNSRILLNHTSAQRIYLPPKPDNGARIRVIDTLGALATYNVILDGNGRLINNAATATLNTANLTITYFFDADANEWVTVGGMTLGVEMPFPIEFDDYFAIKLAGRLNPRYGRSLSEDTLRHLAEVKEQLEGRYRQQRAMPTARGPLESNTPNRFQSNGFRNGRYGWMS